jgi:NOL1/NOP2/fmu family ribosome biogenesis protein
MQKLVVLNTREKRKIIDALAELYGFSGKIEGAFFVSTKQKIFLLPPDIAMLEKSEERALRIDKAGLYIGRVEESGGIRLSIEGSQIIGPYSSKHILEIGEEHLEPWVKGEDFELSEQEKKQAGEEHGFFIIKFRKDFLGCGQVKNNNLRSLVSKDRRLKTLNI